MSSRATIALHRSHRAPHLSHARAVPNADNEAEFLRQGWTVIRNVAHVKFARQLMWGLWKHCAKCHPCVDAKLICSRFPNAPEMSAIDFQALHFDLGAPIAPQPAADLTGFIVGLYCPPEGNAQAQTRIVPLDRIHGNPRYPDARRRLVEYAVEFGDGWTQPMPRRTGRIACLARLLDAVSQRRELTYMYDHASWQWFSHGAYSCGLADERRYFAAHGIDLAACERRECAGPGDLLIVDNLRCAHGRCGRRDRRSIYHLAIAARDVGGSAARHTLALLENLFDNAMDATNPQTSIADANGDGM